MRKNTKNTLNKIEKYRYLVSLLILVVGISTAFFIYQARTDQKTYVFIDEWGVKFNNSQQKYSYTYTFDDSVAVLDQSMSEGSQVCGNSIGVKYYRVATSRLENPDVGTSRLDTLEVISTINGYNYYLEKQAIPDFCGTELKESQDNFDTTIYE